ncbi:MAG: hypothetical protein HWE37_09890 [Rhodobacteraceae bacterium]|uniref:Lipoprotein n=1 Tax=Salipiger thiooxidans TaxID=282683 RepID=A0A1G7IRX7_9RHOB|nr:hypothetical protein [Salipiger thiooxidans]NVK60371.1 hypothetical protein [Paracoccaceae bacterium]SDF15348.1 hypothetical protein SAMN04488105_113127 [Salipiger thiooxidans]
MPAARTATAAALVAVLGLTACAQAPRSRSAPDPAAVAEVTRAVQTPLASTRSQDPLDRVRLGPADIGDVGSTAAGIASGFTEANPLVSWAGGGAPLMLIPVKYAAKKALVSIGTKPARANWTVETAGMFAACNNIALLAGGVPPAAIGIGAVCAIAFSQNSRNGYERRTGRTLDGAPLAQTRVQ